MVEYITPEQWRIEALGHLANALEAAQAHHESTCGAVGALAAMTEARRALSERETDALKALAIANEEASIHDARARAAESMLEDFKANAPHPSVLEERDAALAKHEHIASMWGRRCRAFDAENETLRAEVARLSKIIGEYQTRPT